MRLATLRLVVATMAIGVVACGESSITGSGTNGQLTWRVQNERVDITNASNQSVRYAIVGRTLMHNALIDWCFGMPQCGASLAAHGTATVAYSDIDGAEPPEREAMLVWWSSGSTSDSFDTAVVRIR